MAIWLRINFSTWFCLSLCVIGYFIGIVQDNQINYMPIKQADLHFMAVLGLLIMGEFTAYLQRILLRFMAKENGKKKIESPVRIEYLRSLFALHSWHLLQEPKTFENSIYVVHNMQALSLSLLFSLPLFLLQLAGLFVLDLFVFVCRGFRFLWLSTSA